jgi:hypothetical protein
MTFSYKRESVSSSYRIVCQKPIKEYIIDATNTWKKENILCTIMFNEQRKQIWKLTTGIPHFDQHG